MSTILEKIQLIYQQSSSYPELARKLMYVGVQSYTVDVATGTILYRMGDGNNAVHYGAQNIRSIASNLSLEGTISAIRRSQSGKITYPEFMAEIADAGVFFYEASLKAETPNVTYYGSAASYEEEIPISGT